jgi:hypothetical protein
MYNIINLLCYHQITLFSLCNKMADLDPVLLAKRKRTYITTLTRESEIVNAHWLQSVIGSYSEQMDTTVKIYNSVTVPSLIAYA